MKKQLCKSIGLHSCSYKLFLGHFNISPTVHVALTIIRILNGRTPKQYTREQILKWYNKLHTNGSEYKMWGNGVALPPTLYVMQGIYDVMRDERED